MRDEEILKVRLDMSSKKNIALIGKNSTGSFNRRPQNDQTMNHFLDPDDRNNSTKELPSDDERNWQNEADQSTQPERRSFSRNSGILFNVAQTTAAGESDNELFGPLPLGC